MIFFHSKKITQNQEVVAGELRQAREYKGIKLLDAAKQLNINLKYLEALENGFFNQLPTGLYGKNFLREYAVFLGLNPAELITVFEDNAPRRNNSQAKNLFSPKTPRLYYALSLPKIIRNMLIGAGVLVCLVYLGYCVNNIISAPRLSVFSPVDNFTTKENIINISGATTAEADVVVNGEKVLTDPDGRFNKQINLTTGINQVTISAQKKYSRKNTIVKNILVEN